MQTAFTPMEPAAFDKSCFLPVVTPQKQDQLYARLLPELQVHILQAFIDINPELATYASQLRWNKRMV
jgi:hypothetical protein